VLGDSAKRLIYGTTRVLSVVDDNGQKIAKVSAEISVVDLESGVILYSSNKQTGTFGSSAAIAVDSARRQLGQKVIGEDLVARIP